MNFINALKFEIYAPSSLRKATHNSFGISNIKGLSSLKINSTDSINKMVQIQSINSTDSFLTTFKDVIEKLKSDKFGSISYVLPGLVMLKASAEQFRESYPELFATFEGSYILHVDIILSVPDKKRDLLFALLNPGIHHPTFFTKDEIESGFDEIKIQLDLEDSMIME